MEFYNTRVYCFVEHDEDGETSVLITLNKEPNNSLVYTLEYSNITKDYNSFLDINEYYEIYEDLNDLDCDIEKGYLSRFIGAPKDVPRLDLIINLKIKMEHQAGVCEDSCILCNPDLGDDPFPDFTFDIRNMKTKGSIQ